MYCWLCNRCSFFCVTSEYLFLHCTELGNFAFIISIKTENKYIYSWYLYVSINCRNFRFYSVVEIFVAQKFGPNFRHLAKISSLSTDEIFSNKVYSGTICRWRKMPTTGFLLKLQDVGIWRFYKRTTFSSCDIFCI